MATKEDILKVFAAESGPISINDLAQKMGLSTTQVTTQVNRMLEHKPPLVEKNEDKEYFITDVGRAHLEEKEQLLPPQEVLQRSETPQPIISDYQKFIKLGSQAGITNKELLRATADHIFNGGDYTNLVWVRQALKEADIQPDLANRLTNFWRTAQGKPLSAELKEAMGVDGKVASDGKKPSEGIRSHILDSEDKPVYVGEGFGDLDYKDALDLSKVRSSAKARSAASDGKNQPADPVAVVREVVKMVDEVRGHQEPAVNYVVKPKADGTGYEVATVEPGEPALIPTPAPAPAAAKTYYVDPTTKEVKEAEPGKPVFITLQPAPAPVTPVGGNVIRYLYDKATGQVTQLAGNEPIIIQATPPNPYVPIQFDKDGNPLAPPNLDTWIRLEDFKAEQQRKQDIHEVKIELTKAVRDFLRNGAEVAKRMGQKKE